MSTKMSISQFYVNDNGNINVNMKKNIYKSKKKFKKIFELVNKYYIQQFLNKLKYLYQ